MIRRYNVNNNQEQLPIASAEDVEFSEELADQDDKEAQERARAADLRASGHEGE
nr:YfhD family protein [Cohnella mopanensis]